MTGSLSTFGGRTDTASASLSVAIGLSLWFVAGSVLQAALDGFGDAPARRAIIGIALLAVYGGLLWQIPRVRAALVARPWLVVVFAAVVAVLAVIDERVGSPYFSICLTVVGVGVVVARTLTVWLAVAAASVAAIAGLAMQAAQAGAVEGADIGTVVGAVVGTVLAALLLLGIRGQLERFTKDVAGSLSDVRQALGQRGTPALHAALGGPRGVALPPAARRVAALTPTEIAVVQALSQGRAPKQIARDRGVSLATVRTQIRGAKRKTGARTLRELASMPTRPDWPDVEPL